MTHGGTDLFHLPPAGDSPASLGSLLELLPPVIHGVCFPITDRWLRFGWVNGDPMVRYVVATARQGNTVMMWFDADASGELFRCYRRAGEFGEEWHCKKITKDAYDVFDSPGDWSRPTEADLRASIEQYVSAREKFVKGAA